MFTNVDMPGGMDGLKLAAAIHSSWPGLAWPGLDEGFALRAYLDTEIATNIGISASTLYRWKEAYCEFREALRAGARPPTLQ